VIQSFGDETTVDLFRERNTRAARRIPRELWRTAQRKLKALDVAARLEDLTIPAGNRLELLNGDEAGRHSIRINDQYRVTFRWEQGHAHEVRVEDRDEIGVRRHQAVGERTSLEAGPGTAPLVRDLNSLPAPVRQTPGEDLHGVVVRVVEHLHLESVTRPVDRARGVEDSFRDVTLVVDRQLQAYAWFVSGNETPRS